MKPKLKKILLAVLLVGGIAFLLLIICGTVAQAVGLVDDTVNTQNLYSQYPLNNYQLDFYVDTSWDWLPWNWKDGLGNQIQYGLYAISNFIWTINLYLSNAAGYLVQQAYSLDFISDTASKIGENIQTLAGISQNGFSTSGFYVGFLMIFILIIGIYTGYVGLIKRETTKAIQAVTNFVVVFIVSAGFIAFAPSYIEKVNDFSSDVSQASLDLGAKIILPSSESKGKDSVDLIRNTLFSIQVEQPWLLLQFDNSNKEEIGEDRINSILKTSPDEKKGNERESVVKADIEKHDNQNLTLPKTISRLGTTVFLFLFNIGISIFIFLLTGIMIFSQVLFIIYAMFLPISFLLSMLPTQSNIGKTAIMKLFNTIMLRAGITLIITAAFSVSTMIYTLTSTYPFFLIAFLQIVTFAGIYFRLGDIMSLFNLQATDSQQVGRQVFRRPRQYMHRGSRRISRTGRNLVSGSIGFLAGTATKLKNRTLKPKTTNKDRNNKVPSNPPNKKKEFTNSKQTANQQTFKLNNPFKVNQNKESTKKNQGIKTKQTNPKVPNQKMPIQKPIDSNKQPNTKKASINKLPKRPYLSTAKIKLPTQENRQKQRPSFTQSSNKNKAFNRNNRIVNQSTSRKEKPKIPFKNRLNKLPKELVPKKRQPIIQRKDIPKINKHKRGGKS